MSAFTLLGQNTGKITELPKNTLKNTLIVCQATLHAGTVNLNKDNNSVLYVRGSGSGSSHGNYKLLTRYFDQGKLDSEEDREQYEHSTLMELANRSVLQAPQKQRCELGSDERAG